jgi:hypothetical protein
MPTGGGRSSSARHRLAGETHPWNATGIRPGGRSSLADSRRHLPLRRLARSTGFMRLPCRGPAGLGLSAAAHRSTFTTFDPPASAGTSPRASTLRVRSLGYRYEGNGFPHGFRPATMTTIKTVSKKAQH